MRKYFYVTPAYSKWNLLHDRIILYSNVNKLPVIGMGRIIAKKYAPSELVILNSNGKIAERETYQYDPFPPRG